LFAFFFDYENKIFRCLASILSMPPIQNDQQFIQTMINQGRKKRKLDDEEPIPNPKIRRITIKNEPEQVIKINILHKMIRCFCF